MMKRLQWQDSSKDLDGDTPVHFAAAAGKYHLLFNSLSLRHNVNSQNNIGWTPLMQAARNGHTACVKLLLDFGADVSLKNHFASSGKLETVSLLLKTAIVRNYPISEIEKHISPVFFAVLFNNIDILRYFNKYAYSLNKQITLGGLYPVTVANILNHRDIINYFERRGIMAAFKNSFTFSSPHNISSDIPTFLFSSPADTPYNTPQNYLIPNVSNSRLKLKKRYSSCVLSPVLNTPGISPITPPDVIVKNQLSEVPVLSNNSSNHLMNSRIKLTFSSTSSNDSSIFLPHSKVSQIASGKQRSVSTGYMELNDDVFLSPSNEKNNNSEFANLLRKNSLDSCISLFEKNEIDMDLFLTLSRADLEEIGVDWNKREIVLEVIYQFNKENCQKKIKKM